MMPLRDEIQLYITLEIVAQHYFTIGKNRFFLAYCLFIIFLFLLMDLTQIHYLNLTKPTKTMQTDLLVRQTE